MLNIKISLYFTKNVNKYIYVKNAIYDSNYKNEFFLIK